MSVKIKSYVQAISGMVLPILIEVEILPGFPDFKSIGTSPQSTFGHKERVRFALKNSGFKPSRSRQTISIVPAVYNLNTDHLDLSLAVAVIARTGQAKYCLDNNLFFGKLNLDGTIQSSNGIVQILESINYNDFSRIFLPFELKDSCQHMSQNFVFCKNLNAVIDKLSLKTLFETGSKKLTPKIVYPSFENISGLDFAKRAIILATTYNLKLLLIGFPGVGKTMLAKSAKNLNPNYIEVLPISPKSAFLKANLSENIFSQNPNSVIVINELTELKADSVEALRYILDQPNKCTLIATMNPCRCGYFGHAEIPCKCSPSDIRLFNKKLPAPFLDRFDIILNLNTEPTIIESQSDLDFVQTQNALAFIEKSAFPKPEVNVSLQFLSPDSLAIFKELTVKYSVNFRRAYKILNLAYYIACYKRYEPNGKPVKIQLPDLKESLAYQSYVIPKLKNQSQPASR